MVDGHATLVGHEDVDSLPGGHLIGREGGEQLVAPSGSGPSRQGDALERPGRGGRHCENAACELAERCRDVGNDEDSPVRSGALSERQYQLRRGVMPLVAVASEQDIGFVRSPGARRIGRKRRVPLGERVEVRIDYAPGLFCLVGT